MVKIEKKLLFQALISFFFGVAGAFLVVAASHSTTSVAMVDIVMIKDSFIKDTASQNLSEGEKNKKVDQFANALNESLQNISKKRKLILVPSEAILAGTSDATREVVAEMKKRMRA